MISFSSPYKSKLGTQRVFLFLFFAIVLTSPLKLYSSTTDAFSGTAQPYHAYSTLASQRTQSTI